MLFGSLCLGVSALVAGYGVDWQRWIFQIDCSPILSYTTCG